MSVQLTFACELDQERLTRLFADTTVIGDLCSLKAGVTMMVSDFSAERAAVVRRLNEASIPVIGIPLFPAAEGYDFTVNNAAHAASRYELWKAWTQRYELHWDGVGLASSRKLNSTSRSCGTGGAWPSCLHRACSEGGGYAEHARCTQF